MLYQLLGGYYFLFNFFCKYSGNSSINLYFDTPIFDDEFLSVVCATNVSASLHSRRPIVGSYYGVYSRISIALT